MSSYGYVRVSSADQSFRQVPSWKIFFVCPPEDFFEFDPDFLIRNADKAGHLAGVSGGGT